MTPKEQYEKENGLPAMTVMIPHGATLNYIEWLEIRYSIYRAEAMAGREFIDFGDIHCARRLKDNYITARRAAEEGEK